jgi:hypothetical protein
MLNSPSALTKPWLNPNFNDVTCRSINILEPDVNAYFGTRLNGPSVIVGALSFTSIITNTVVAGVFDTATGTFTCPKSGAMRITFDLNISSVVAAQIQYQVNLNGVTQQSANATCVIGVPQNWSYNYLFDVAAGDTVTMTVLNNNNANIILINQCRFMGNYV